jgi:hypothetical protein
VDLGDHGSMPCGRFDGLFFGLLRSDRDLREPDRCLSLQGRIVVRFPGPNPTGIHRPLDRLPGSVPRLALLGASRGNICPRSLRILLDGPGSFALAGKPHGANEPGSDPTDVSDAAGGG